MYEKALVVKHAGMFYLFLARHRPDSSPFLNWHNGSRDIRGVTGCVLLGAAAFRYSITRLIQSRWIRWVYVGSIAVLCQFQ